MKAKQRNGIRNYINKKSQNKNDIKSLENFNVSNYNFLKFREDVAYQIRNFDIISKRIGNLHLMAPTLSVPIPIRKLLDKLASCSLRTL